MHVCTIEHHKRVGGEQQRKIWGSSGALLGGLAAAGLKLVVGLDCTFLVLGWQVMCLKTERQPNRQHFQALFVLLHIATNQTHTLVRFS